MKNLLLLFLAIEPIFAQSFEGTVFDLNSGRLQVIEGTFNVPKPSSHNEYIARLRADTDRIFAEIAASRAQAQLEEQTRLLRQIAEKE